ncbi:hypothetical protein ANN_15784 [Periplaneta americana]|uniref:Uncharacterized protein n=1 Tax=Periplaneta americana TaxID=6978 RepID=A0ABQ8SH68_PERAM|nr:hypothetical protein ANN_15784 [Periplaneta americana]
MPRVHDVQIWLDLVPCAREVLALGAGLKLAALLSLSLRPVSLQHVPTCSSRRDGAAGLLGSASRGDACRSGQMRVSCPRLAAGQLVGGGAGASRRHLQVSVCVSVVSGMSDDEDEEGRRGNTVPARSLLQSNSTKGAARLNVPIRRTNYYQQ